MSDVSASLKTLFDFYGQQVQNRPATFVQKKNSIRPEDLYSLEALQNHLNNPLLDTSWIQVVEKGKILDLASKSYTKSVQSKNLHFLDKSALQDTIEKGAALVLE